METTTSTHFFFSPEPDGISYRGFILSLVHEIHNHRRQRQQTGRSGSSSRVDCLAQPASSRAPAGPGHRGPLPLACLAPTVNTRADPFQPKSSWSSEREAPSNGPTSADSRKSVGSRQLRRTPETATTSADQRKRPPNQTTQIKLSPAPPSSRPSWPQFT